LQGSVPKFIWGIGPAVLLPTGTDGITTNRWGPGATGAALVKKGPWTVGGGLRCWSASPDFGAQDRGARLNLVFPFPT
jgi:hypothetical protein